MVHNCQLRIFNGNRVLHENRCSEYFINHKPLSCREFIKDKKNIRSCTKKMRPTEETPNYFRIINRGSVPSILLKDNAIFFEINSISDVLVLNRNFDFSQNVSVNCDRTINYNTTTNCEWNACARISGCRWYRCMKVSNISTYLLVTSWDTMANS